MFLRCLLILLGFTYSAHAELQLGVSQESYFAREEFLYGEKDYTNLSARFKTYGDGKNWDSGLSLGAQVSPNVDNYSVIYAPEFFVTYSHEVVSALPNEVTIGRKILPWSKLDADWGLGIFQPLLRWDYLHPEQQGLTGLFLGWKGQDASLTFFASGIYVPEQGPSYEIQNQKLTSPSPWFSEPANSAIITSGDPSEINYTLHLPEISSIIFRPSMGGMFLIGKLDEGGSVKAAYTYKPRNRVPIPFVHRVDPSGDVFVDIYPRVENHHVGSFDVGFTSQRGGGEFTRFSISTLLEVPNNPEAESSVNRQKLKLQSMVSPAFEMKLMDAIFPELSLRTAYLYQADGETSGEGPLIEAGASPESLFGYRNDFTNAYMLGVGFELLGSSASRLETNLRWIEEFDQKASLLMVEFRYNPAKQFGILVAGDFMGARVDESEENGLITKYRGNDRVLGGITYAF